MSAARHLHVVRRPSVIVDLERRERMTPPWASREDLEWTPAIPQPVLFGMWIAAWAHAEDCGLLIERGCLQPCLKYEPSEGLCAALGRSMPNVVGSLFFAIPLRYGDESPEDGGRPHRAWGACWQGTLGLLGKWGAN